VRSSGWTPAPTNTSCREAVVNWKGDGGKMCSEMSQQLTAADRLRALPCPSGDVNSTGPSQQSTSSHHIHIMTNKRHHSNGKTCEATCATSSSSWDDRRGGQHPQTGTSFKQLPILHNHFSTILHAAIYSRRRPEDISSPTFPAAEMPPVSCSAGISAASGDE
jgi:hypothetical protein